ncbi:oleosin-B6-like [Andrographis paniculata]|uniref:oleosin-B6-like n=1 Tax=Andrographis paniculata TaxID=175694 RepID=UPI0021E89C5E|nr:oleosin-B6-like [Andrographis paniculata]
MVVGHTGSACPGKGSVAGCSPTPTYLDVGGGPTYKRPKKDGRPGCQIKHPKEEEKNLPDPSSPNFQNRPTSRRGLLDGLDANKDPVAFRSDIGSTNRPADPCPGRRTKPTPPPTEPEAAAASTDSEATAQPMAILPVEIIKSFHLGEEPSAPAAAVLIAAVPAAAAPIAAPPPPEAARQAAEPPAAVRPGGPPHDVEEISSSESETSVNLVRAPELISTHWDDDSDSDIGGPPHISISDKE